MGVVLIIVGALVMVAGLGVAALGFMGKLAQATIPLGSLSALGGLFLIAVGCFYERTKEIIRLLAEIRDRPPR